MADRIVGFTGSRVGITPKQEQVLEFILSKISPREVHHGECIGADAKFHEVVQRVLPNCHIIGHPPYSDLKQAQGLVYYAETEKKGYLQRDRDIVDACNILIGMPKSGHGFYGAKGPDNPYNKWYGGTWYTIQYALDQGKEVVVVYGTGRIERHEAVK